MWTKKSKGAAKLYLHPDLDRAIVVVRCGPDPRIEYAGKRFESVEAAQAAALAER